VSSVASDPARFRLRAFERDWLEPLLEGEDSPLRSLLLSEAEAWLTLGQKLGYFGAGPVDPRLRDRPRDALEDAVGEFGAVSLGSAEFAHRLLEAQDDLTGERREFLELALFAEEREWRERLAELAEVPGLLTESGESHAPPALADRVGWGLIGFESEIEAAGGGLPAGWRAGDLTALRERLPHLGARLAALERTRVQIANVASALSRAEHPAPAVRDPLAAAEALVEAKLFDDADVVLAAGDADDEAQAQLLRGKIAIARSELDTAAAAFEQASEAGLGEAALLLGRLRIETGHEEEGVEALERAASLGEERAFMSLAEFHQQRGGREAALDAVDRGSRVEDPLSIISLAGTLVLADHPDRAADLLVGTGRRFPADALMQIALMLYERGDMDEAIVVLREADIAGSTRAAPLLGQVHQRRDELEAAETWMRKAIAAGSTRTILNLGNVLSARGDREGAEEQFRLAVEAGDSGAYANLGQLLQDRGDAEGAQRAFEDAIEAEDAAGHALLGRLLYLEDGDPAEAERHFAAAIEAGRYETVHFFNALLIDQERYAESRDLMREAADREVGEAWAALGITYQALDRPDEARRAYEQGLEAGDAVAAYNVGVVCQEEDDLEAAQRAYERAAELGFKAAANNLGVVLLGQGKEEEAERWFEQAIEQRDPRGLVALGSMQAGRGRLERAREMGELAAAAGEPAGHLLVAQMAEREGRDEDAREAREEAKRKGIAPAWGRSALAIAASGDLEAAREEAERGWRDGDPLSGLLVARSLRYAEDFDAAETVAREVLELTRERGNATQTLWQAPRPAGASTAAMIPVPVGSSHALGELGAILAAQDRFEEAVPALAEAAGLGRDEAAFNLALLHRRRGETAEERSWLRKAADLGEGHAALRLARIYAEEGDEAAAEREFARTEEMSPGLDRSRGMYLLARGRFAAAERCFAKAAEVEFTFAEDTFHVAYCREKLGDLVGAAEAYEKVAEEIPQAAHNLGVVMDREGDKDRALAAYRLAADAGKPESRSNLAATLLEVGKFDEAEAILAPLMSDEPRANDLVNYGVLLSRQGRPSEALARFREAAEELPEALLNVGRTEVEEGELTQAVTTFRRALELGVDAAARDLGEAYEKLGELEEAEAVYRAAWEAGDTRVAVRLGFLAARLERVTEDLERAMASFRPLAPLADAEAGLLEAEPREPELVEVRLG
jgi:tetratricopeptide (TPR) repeat protein